MRLGVVIPQARAWTGLLEEFSWAQDVGYDVAYVYDHLTHPTARGEWLADGFTVLGAAAVSTSTIGLGTLVASATLHSPVALARLASTVDDISGGRLVLGLGAGSPRCSSADRGEHPTPRDMYDRLEDVVVGLRAVWAGETEWTGRHRSYAGLETLPYPDGAGPSYLMLAAHGPRALALAARYADGWNTYGGPGSDDQDADDYWRGVAGQVERFEAACAEAGRDPAEPRRSLLVGYGTVRPTASVDAFLDTIDRARDLGFDELVVYAPGSPGEGFASDRKVHEQAVARVRN